MRSPFDLPPMLAIPSRRQSGFAIISAIFILVVLAAMAAFIVHVSTHQSAGHVADVQGIRAYQAARTGIEWGLYNHLRPPQTCAAASSFALGGNLAGFTVTVRCTPSDEVTNNNEAGTSPAGTQLFVRRIVATACNQPAGAPATCPNLAPGANYVERELAVVAGR